jgi:hypothetical protein
VKVPAAFHDLFWDCRPAALDTDAHAPFILERLLEYGTQASARWTLDIYGAERLKAFLRERGVRTLSRKTLSFWILLLGLEGEACFDTSSLKRSRPFWNY